MVVHLWQIIAVFFLTLGASTFSGMAGGGGGFIVLPALIALGLSPQQAVATGKLSGFGLMLGSVAVFKRRAFNNPKLLLYFVVLAATISLFVPHIFKSISGKNFQIILGLLILILIPLVISEKHGLKQQVTSPLKKAIGTIFFSGALVLQGVFSGGIGSINNVVLTTFFGLSTLQAGATRRVVTLALNIFIVIALITTTHFIIYKLAITGAIGSFIGGYIGSHIALRKGERFAKLALAVFMLFSGIALLVTA